MRKHFILASLAAATFAAETGGAAAEAAPAKSGPALLSKVSLANFKPKQILALPEETRELSLGHIVGIASGIKVGKQADGVTPYEGMKGDFKIVRPDGSEERSGVCFLPDAFMSPILGMLRDETDADGEVVREAVKSVQLGFEVLVIRADNPAGYSWKLKPLLQPAQNDPLAELSKLIPAPTPAPAIEDKSAKGKAA